MKVLARLSQVRGWVALALLVLAGGWFAFAPTAARSEPETVAFLRRSGDFWQLWVMGLDGSSPRQLTTSPLDKHSPSWCPGNEVLHYYNEAGTAMLVDLGTGREESQTPLIPHVLGPRTPDGGRVTLPESVQRRLDPHASTRLRCGDPDSPRAETVTLYELDAPVGKALAIQTRQVSDPALSFEMKIVDLGRPSDIGKLGRTDIDADVRRIVATDGQTVLVRNGTNGSEIWLRAPDGSKEQLTELGAATDHPAWSADGEWLLFDSTFQGSEQIFRVNRSRRTVIERITDGRAPSKHPVIRPSAIGGE